MHMDASIAIRLPKRDLRSISLIASGEISAINLDSPRIPIVKEMKIIEEKSTKIITKRSQNGAKMKTMKENSAKLYFCSC